MVYRTCAFIIFFVTGVTAGVAAQTTGTSPTSPSSGAFPFVFQSDNGDNRLQIGALAQLDGRFALGDTERFVTNTFLVRRLRTTLQGRAARYFDFYLNIDFAGGNVNVRDAYIDTRFSDAFRVRVGKMKAPFSYERLLYIGAIPFVERGSTTAVAPDRDVGVGAFHDLFHGVVSLAGALTNGTVDGGSSDVDSGDGKDLTGRIVVRPWTTAQKHPLAGLGVAFAGSTGTQPSALPTFRTPAQAVWFSYADAAGEGRRTRLSPQAFYYKGPFGGYAEYVRSHGAVRKGDVVSDITHSAWQVSGGWVLTGEAASERNVRPNKTFDPAAHQWGAFQIVARYESLSVDPDAIALGFAAAGSSQAAHAFTAGANWYPNTVVKWMLDAERTVFDSDRAPENAILLRAQVSF